jgi:hypothetical protein
MFGSVLVYPVLVKPVLGKMQPFARGSLLLALKTVQTKQTEQT